MDYEKPFKETPEDLIKQGEGGISNMYLDTVGKVTVGGINILLTATKATELKTEFEIGELTLAGGNSPTLN